MRLPKAEHAIVDDSKIRDYLLSAEHPIGRFKAVFFTALGYTRDDWRRLRDDVLRIAAAGEATPGHPSEFGEKYEVPGVIEGPNGRRAGVLTVWIVLTGERSPRFVTAFPGLVL